MEKLKEIRPDIPVVLCTGFSDSLTGDTAKRLGIEGFLMKPIVMHDLSNTIRDVLAGKQAP